MNDENRRLGCDALGRRRPINDVTSASTTRRLPRDPIARCHQRDASATRLPSRVETVVRTADGFDVVRRTAIFQRSESVNDVEKTFYDGRMINAADRRRNNAELTSSAVRRAGHQRRQYQEYCQPDRPWNSLDLPAEQDPASIRRRRPLSASPLDANNEEYDIGDAACRTARHSTRQQMYRVSSGANITRQGFDEELCTGGRVGRGRGPVRTASFDVDSSRRSTDAGSWHAAGDDWYASPDGDWSPVIIQTQLPRSRSDTRKRPSQPQHCTPVESNSHPQRRDQTPPQDRISTMSSGTFFIGRPIGDESRIPIQTVQRQRGTSSAVRLQDQPLCFVHNVQPVATGKDSDARDSSSQNHKLVAEAGGYERRYHSSATNHPMTSLHMKPNKDDTGYKSNELRQSELHGPLDRLHSDSPSMSSSAQRIVSTTSASSTTVTTCLKDAVKFEASSNSDTKAQNGDRGTGEVTSSDPSQWMIDWIQWRKGKKDFVENTNVAENEESVNQTLASGMNKTPESPEKVIDDGVKSPSANESPSKNTAGNGTRLGVLKNLTRGLEKTLTEAEHSLGSAISQAAERLLKRRTSSAEETGPSSAAAADMAAEISFTTGYGIPARCADSFSRTNYRTASRRRREFRTRCGRLNNEDGSSGGVYRDSV